MKNNSLWIMAILAGPILINPMSALAQDWPQWRGANRDGKVSEITAPQDWSNVPTQKWRVTVGDGDATPALVGDRLYVFTRQGEDEVTRCLNAADGKEIWSDRYAAAAVKGPAVRHAGPRSSPTVAEGKVLTFGAAGVFSCLDAATGEVLWRKDEFPGVVPAYYTSMSPIIVDGLAIGHLGGKDNGAVVAFDLSSGDEKWRWSGAGPAYASPVTMTVDGTKQVVVQTEKDLIAFAPGDGEVLWQIETPAAPRATSSATPIIDGQNVIFTGQGKGTHAIKIAREGEGFAVSPVWSNEDVGTRFNTPVLEDGLLFGISDAGFFYCLNAETGEELWTETKPRDRFGATIGAGSAILALPTSAELIAFKTSGEGYEELARITVAESATYAHPIISGNRLFVKDQETLALLTLE